MIRATSRFVAFAFALILTVPSVSFASGKVPCIDIDRDGYGNPGAKTCPNGPAADCADGVPYIHPGAVESCNGKDDDCNGLVDDVIGAGGACSVGVGSCVRAGTLACRSDGSLGCSAVPGPPQTEICGNGIDEDCDGSDLECPHPPPPPTQISSRDLNALYPGSWSRGSSATSPSAESHALVNLYSLLVLGPGKGKSSLNELYSAAVLDNQRVTILRYLKAVGLYSSSVPGKNWDENYGYDALAQAGVPAVTTDGSPVFNTFNGWSYVKVQDAAARKVWIKNRGDLVDALDADRITEGFYGDNWSVLITTPGNSFTTPGPPAGYADAQWYAGLLDVASQLRTRFPAKIIAANSYAGWAATGARGLELLDSIDVLFYEGWIAHVDGTSRPKPWERSRYIQQILDASRVIQRGKIAVAIDDVSSTDFDRRLFRVGSLLLATDGSGRLKSCLRVKDTATDLDIEIGYGNALRAVGLPTGPWFDDGAILGRSFQTGRVFVNPDPSSHSINVPEGTWMQMSLAGGTSWNDIAANATWSPVQQWTITLPAQSAVVLKAAN